MTKIYSISNMKGGVGKTFLTTNLAKLFKQDGKTLIIDLDYQHNATNFFMKNEEIPDLHKINGIFDKQTPRPLMVEDNLYLLGASAKLFEFSNNTSFKDYFLLKAYLNKIKKVCSFDTIVIDCPPNSGIFLVNAYLVSDFIVIPLDVSTNSVNGVTLVESLKKDVEVQNEKLEILGCIFNNYADNKIDRKIMKDFESKYNKLLFKTVIPRTTKVKIANEKFNFVIDIFPKEKISRAIKQLYNEIIERSK